MADWQTDARNAARRYGLGDWFVRQMGQEAHGADLTSPAGAQGPAQFMPGTARGVGLNSTTVHQRVPSYNAAAKLMAGYVHQYGSVQNALVAYNAGPGRVGHALPAETRGYISTILGGSNPPATSSPSSGTDAASGSTPGVSLPTPGAQPDLGQASDFTGLLSALLSKPQPQAVASSQPMQAPSFSAGPPLPQGFRGLLSAAPQAAQGPSVDDALGLISALGGQAGPSVQSSSGATGSVSATGSPSSPSDATAGFQVPKGAPKGVATFDGKEVAAWIAPALEYARKHGWKGTVSSGYRSFGQQKRIYDSGVRPAAVPGTSNHEGTTFPRGAVDVTSAQQLSSILSGSPYGKRLVWAGGKDPVHFSHPHGGHY